MADEPQVQLDAIPWYNSPQQVGHVTTAISAFLALSPKIANWLGHLLGVDLSTPAAIQTAVEVTFGLVVLVAPIIGARLRARSKIQPLVLSQKKADVVNAPAADPVQPTNKP